MLIFCCVCYIYATNVADNHFHETVKLIVHDFLATLTIRHPDLQRYIYKVANGKFSASTASLNERTLYSLPRSFLLLPHLRL